MLEVKPARLQPKRAPGGAGAPTQQVKTYLAPTKGLITSSPVAAHVDGSAVVLENFWPTTTGIQPRAGAASLGDLGSSVDSVFGYQNGPTVEHFAANETDIYRIDPTGEDAPVSVFAGQSNGDYSTLSFQSDGGVFLTACNGEDAAIQYDGSIWSSVAITGVDTSFLSYVWAHRNRTFFIEKDTMNVWYLGVNSIAGSATKLPLSGVFNNGGSLLFGATWSSDSGSGMDDRAVFVTDQGEFAVYAGSDPGDVNNWSLQGVYRLGTPLGKHAHFSVAGDLVIATTSGLVPLSAAVSKDPSQLQVSALSYNISPDWQKEAALSPSGWIACKWPMQNAAVVSPKSITNRLYVVNLETGAWSIYTGWNPSALGQVDGDLFFGQKSGKTFKAGVGGTDGGFPFECRVCFSFDSLGAPASLKTAHNMRALWAYTADFRAVHSIAVDFAPSFKAAPASVAITETVTAKWDVTKWDTTPWAQGISSPKYKEHWEPARGHGRALAAQVQITSGEGFKLNCELAAVDLIYSVGGVF